MKKTLLTLTVVLMAVFSMNAQAQDITLSIDGETLGESITVWGDPGDAEIVFLAIVHNNTDRDMNIKVRRNRLEMVEGTVSQFCWGGACWPPDTEESPQADTIAAGGQSAEGDFSAHYNPNTHIGTSTVEYLFYNEDNEDQNVKITVYFWASPQSIAEDAMKGGSISDVYPNPAVHTVNFDYNMPATVTSAKVSIVNLLGSVVKETVVEPNANKLSMDISELEDGIYFYNVIVNGKIYKTKKLIIQ